MATGYWPGRADRDRHNVYVHWYIIGSTFTGKPIFRSAADAGADARVLYRVGTF
eukprot:SAG31_NODE_2108_length_6427_cov_7.816688_5_plen_54_part_00